jgi:hypothetical protein
MNILLCDMHNMARFFALSIAITFLASCTSGGVIGDLLPHWAGGYPKNAPPRPGTPEYEVFRQELEAKAGREKESEAHKPNVETEKNRSPQ